MRDDVYKSFLKQMNGIIEDCCVDNAVAEKDPKRYTTYQMKMPANKGIKLSYDNEKVKKHIDTLRKICSEVPQTPIAHQYVIEVVKLQSDALLKETDRNVQIKKAKQQSNLAELFLSMCETSGIILGINQKPDKPTVIYGLMGERIRSRYQGNERDD